jgi:hypothetical protein
MLGGLLRKAVAAQKAGTLETGAVEMSSMQRQDSTDTLSSGGGNSARSMAPSTSGIGPLGMAMAAAARFRAAAARSTKSKFALPLNPKDPADADKTPLGVPIREMLIQIYNYKRDMTIRDLFIYLAYVIVFVSVMYQINNTKSNFSQSDAVYQAWIDQEIPSTPSAPVSFKKNYLELDNVGDMVAWLSGVFVPALYQEEYYNGDAIPASERQFINGQLRVVEGARIRQVRVRNDTSCSVLQRSSLSDTAQLFGHWLNHRDGCRGPLDSPAKLETRPFGPPSNRSKYHFTPGLPSNVRGKRGWGEESYGNGAYVVFLPRVDRAAGDALVSELLEDRFFDDYTRAVAIDLNLFSPEMSQLTVMRFLFEFSATGAMVNSYSMVTLKVLLYSAASDKLRAAGEIIVGFGCIYYLLVEVSQMWNSQPRLAYFRNLANAFDIVLQLMMVIIIGFWSFHITSDEWNEFAFTVPCQRTGPLYDTAYGAATCFHDLYNYARNYSYAVAFAGSLGLLMSLKFFKFFALQRRMNTLWLTLARAGKALAGFIVGFGLLIAGFAFMAQMVFGSSIGTYHTFESAFSTLTFGILMNDFDYEQLSSVQPIVAPIFFSTYMGLIIIIALNMTVGIISMALEEVNDSLKMEDHWKHAGRSYESYLMHRLHNLTIDIRQAFARPTSCCRRYKGRIRNSRRLPRAFNGSNEMVINPGRLSIRSTEQVRAREAKMMAEARAGRPPEISDEVEIEELHETFSRESFYINSMASFIEQSEINSRTDLLKYFDEIHKTVGDTKNIYIGLGELCTLARDQYEPIDPFCLTKHRWTEMLSFARKRADMLIKRGQELSEQKRTEQQGSVSIASGAVLGIGNLTEPVQVLDEQSAFFSLCDPEVFTALVGQVSPNSSGLLRRIIRPSKHQIADHSSAYWLEDIHSIVEESMAAGKVGRHLLSCGKRSHSSRSPTVFRCCKKSHAVPVSSERMFGSNNAPKKNRRRADFSVSAAVTLANLAHPANQAVFQQAVTALSVDMVSSVYRPSCKAWSLVLAYYAYKDVTMLGDTDRHSYMMEKTVGRMLQEARLLATGERSEVLDGMVMAPGMGNTRDPLVRGTWLTIKTNRNGYKQRRWLTIKEDSLDSDTFIVMVNGVNGQLKRRFLLSQVVQIEASMTIPRRLHLYMEADGIAEDAVDPSAKFSLRADTVYDLLFMTQEDRTSFIDGVISLREQSTRAQKNDEELLYSLTGTSRKQSIKSGRGGNQEGVEKLLINLFRQSRRDLDLDPSSETPKPIRQHLPSTAEEDVGDDSDADNDFFASETSPHVSTVQSTASSAGSGLGSPKGSAGASRWAMLKASASHGAADSAAAPTASSDSSIDNVAVNRLSAVQSISAPPPLHAVQLSSNGSGRGPLGQIFSAN